MRLIEEPEAKDLEVVEYWVKPSGRAWLVNEDNVPLDSAGNAFIMDDSGIPVIEGDEPIPERIVFKLKMLLGRDHNAITQAMIKTKTRAGRRGKNRAIIETDIDLAKSVNLKLQKAIVDWSGITDKDGNEARITAENIDLLPAWIQNDLVDKVSEMSEISEDDEGE